MKVKTPFGEHINYNMVNKWMIGSPRCIHRIHSFNSYKYLFLSLECKSCAASWVCICYSLQLSTETRFILKTENISFMNLVAQRLSPKIQVQNLCWANLNVLEPKFNSWLWMGKWIRGGGCASRSFLTVCGNTEMNSRRQKLLKDMHGFPQVRLNVN